MHYQQWRGGGGGGEEEEEEEKEEQELNHDRTHARGAIPNEEEVSGRSLWKEGGGAILAGFQRKRMSSNAAQARSADVEERGRWARAR